MKEKSAVFSCLFGDFKFRFSAIVILLICLKTSIIYSQTNFISSGTYTVPAGVCLVRIESWGAGGGGGGVISGFLGSNVRASGGGGGAYSVQDVVVLPGQQLLIEVGTGGTGGNGENDGNSGGNTSVSRSGIVLCAAEGGKGGKYHRGNGNTGSSSANGGSSGISMLYLGGNGGGTGDNNGDGGGGSAGTYSNGGNGSDTQRGNAGANGGGYGAYPQTSDANGLNATEVGGGGGGAKNCRNCGSMSGGNGFRGQVKITPLKANAGADKSTCSDQSIVLNGSLDTYYTNHTSSVFRFTGAGNDRSNYTIGGNLTGLPSDALITNIVINANIYSGTGTSTNCNQYALNLLINDQLIEEESCGLSNYNYMELNGTNPSNTKIQIQSKDKNWLNNATNMVLTVVVHYKLIATPSFSWSGSNFTANQNTLTPTVKPTTTTNYTLTANYGSCTTSDIVSVQVNPIINAEINSENTSLCHGNEFTLSGKVNATNAWSLQLSNGETISGNGTSTWTKKVKPTVTTTYSITNSNVCTTVTGSTTLTLPTKTTQLASNGETSGCIVKANETVHFYAQNTGNYIATVTASTSDLGLTNATVYVDQANQLVGACSDLTFQTAVMQRHWVITPTNNSAATVRLPFRNEEINRLADAALTSSNPTDQFTTISELKLSKYAGPNNVNASASDNCLSLGGNGETEIFSSIVTGTTPVSNINANYADFSVLGFSEFWLHGSSTASPLAVELTKFESNCDLTTSTIKWETASEQQSDYFILEQSTDGVNWTTLVTKKANGTTSKPSVYQFSTAKLTKSYIRLTEVDYSGNKTIYDAIYSNCENTQTTLTIFPNPTTGNFKVRFESPNEEQATLVIYDLFGKQVYQETVAVTEGLNLISFNDKLAKGTYIVAINSSVGNHFAPVKLVCN